MARRARAAFRCTTRDVEGNARRCKKRLKEKGNRMTLALTLAQIETPQIQSTALVVTICALLVAGLVGWLIATILGFSRARVFGPSTRWFALSALCLLIYHIHFIAFGLLGMVETDMAKLLSFGSFFNLFVFLGSICAIIGFMRLSNPRP
jgi:hypothetical protein